MQNGDGFPEIRRTRLSLSWYKDLRTGRSDSHGRRAALRHLLQLLSDARAGYEEASHLFNLVCRHLMGWLVHALALRLAGRLHALYPFISAMPWRPG